MAAFTKNSGSNLVVDMQVMDLPTIEQTSAEIAAFQSGRSHLTFDYEPHAAYGVREGQIVIAQSQDGGEQTALRVQGQHPIDATLVATAGAAQRWAEVEKSASAVLFEKLSASHEQGKALWGLNVQPLGEYVRGQIKPFVALNPDQPLTNDKPLVEVDSSSSHVAEQLVQEPPELQQLWEKYSAQNSGVLDAIAAHNPQLREDLDRVMANQAIEDGCPVEMIKEAIAQHSTAAQKSGQPDIYAQNVVAQVERDTAKATQPNPKRPSQAKTQGRQSSKRAKTKANDNGMGY
jgi:hypothetical protein